MITKSTKCGTGKPGIKRQRSNDIQVPDGKRLKQYNSLISALELLVAIIDRNRSSGKIAMD